MFFLEIPEYLRLKLSETKHNNNYGNAGFMHKKTKIWVLKTESWILFGIKVAESGISHLVCSLFCLVVRIQFLRTRPHPIFVLDIQIWTGNFKENNRKFFNILRN